MAFVGKYDQYLHVVFTVPADTVEYRYTAMGFFGDAIGNPFIFFGENKELNRLPGAIDNVIQYKPDDKQSYKTKYHTSPVMKYHVAGTDDDEVTGHYHASQCDILVFVDDGCNNICTSRTSISRKSNTYAASTEGCSDDTCHKGLVVEKPETCRQFLNDGQKEGEGKYTKNSFDAKL